MRCAKVQDRLVLYLAGEVSPGEAARIIDHVSRCSGCMALAEDLAATQEQLVSVLRAKIEAPASLDARVMAAVRDLTANQKAAAGADSFRRPVVYAASICCAILITLAITIARNSATSSVNMASLGEAHNELTTAESPNQYPRSDPNLLAQELAPTVKFPVRVSDLTPEGAHLVGGNTITVENSTMVELHYEWQGKQVSIFEMESSNRTPAALRQLGREPNAYYAHKAGYMAYIAWHSGETECVMVAREVPMHQLFHLACKACERQETQFAEPSALTGNSPISRMSAKRSSGQFATAPDSFDPLILFPTRALRKAPQHS